MARTRNLFSFSLAIISSAVLFFSPALQRPAAAADELSVFFEGNQYVWKEIDDDGSRLLKESGVLFGVGVTYWNEMENHLTVRPTGELFGGSVHYNGLACEPDASSCEPAVTSVNYFGFKVEGDLGGRIASRQGAYLEPFGGLGFRYWLRMIQDGTTQSGLTTAGYTEEWLTLYTRLGLRAGIPVSEGKNELFIEGGYKYPLFNQNTAYVSSIGFSNDTTVNPGKKGSFFGEAGMRINSVKLSVFYDSMRFTKSNFDFASNAFGTFRFNQPESTADFYGFKIGVII